jgi:hypothetical protein
MQWQYYVTNAGANRRIRMIYRLYILCCPEHLRHGGSLAGRSGSSAAPDHLLKTADNSLFASKSTAQNRQQRKKYDSYCELHINRPEFVHRKRLFSGVILQIAPAQSAFQWEIGRLLCNSQ